MTNPADLFHDWHDFYLLLGTASATLVGLMFVAASIGSTFFNEEHAAGSGAFLTPTVSHFGTVLFGSLVITIPTHRWETFGGLIGAAGLAGSIYCARILGMLIIRPKFKVGLHDRIFYALVPFLGYLMVLGSGVLGLAGSASSANLLAVGLCTLLVAGIRNAWDMMVWIMLKAPTGNDPPRPDSSS